MTNIEKKLIGIARKYAPLIIFVIATLAGMLIRMAGMDFRSDDYNSFLSGWWNVIADQDFSGLSQQVGNYNIPYQVIIFFLTRITGEALHAYKIVSIVFDFALAGGVGLLVANHRRESFFSFVPALSYAVTLCTLTVVLNSSFWGQCDSMYVSLIIFAIFCTMKDKHIPAFVLLGAALAFKLQMVFILPLYIYYYVSSKKISILHFFIIPLTDIVMCLPAVFCGRPFMDIIKIYADQTDYGKQIQMNYPNVYAFMCNGQSVENYYLLKPLSIVLTMGILAAGLFLVLPDVPLVDARAIFVPARHSAYRVLLHDEEAPVRCADLAAYQPARLLLLPVCKLRSSDSRSDLNNQYRVVRVRHVYLCQGDRPRQAGAAVRSRGKISKTKDLRNTELRRSYCFKLSIKERRRYLWYLSR